MDFVYRISTPWSLANHVNTRVFGRKLAKVTKRSSLNAVSHSEGKVKSGQRWIMSRTHPFLVMSIADLQSDT